jgi:serine beta-lactamase-like protein LACTB, mitochondrial
MLGLAGIGLVIAAVLGLFAYMSLSARPLHPDPQKVPSVTGSAPPPAWVDAAKKAEQIARADLLEQNLPGLSVAVGVGTELVWAEGFGHADLANQAPVTPDTRFRIGEVSKPLTSAAVGLLLEQHKLNLDDEIQKYVPDFPRKQWPVTLRELMAHTAGLRDDGGDEARLEPCERTSEGLEMFADHSLRFEPGTNYQASSYSWILVSAAVEAAASGQSFFSFIRSQVFEPLGMSSSKPYSATQESPHQATFYFPQFAGDPRYGPQDVREGDHTCYAGASAFLSTPSDLVRFGLAINGGKLLKPATVQLLQTSQRLASGAETGYGLGWTVETLPLAGRPTRMVGHGTKGDFIGGSAYLMSFPERGVVVAVTSNTSFGEMRKVALKIAEVFAAGR